MGKKRRSRPRSCCAPSCCGRRHHKQPSSRAGASSVFSHVNAETKGRQQAFTQSTNKQSSPQAALWRNRSRCRPMRLRFSGVAVAELLDATAHVVHRFLGAGVEGVRFAGCIQFEQRQLTTVVELDGFFGVHARTCHELKTVGQIHEAHFAVIRMDAFFHGMYSSKQCGSRARPSDILSAKSFIITQAASQMRNKAVGRLSGSNAGQNFTSASH